MKKDDMIEQILHLRDKNRPKLETVYEALAARFASMAPTIKITLVETTGDSWIWRDEKLHENGLDKFYVLSQATAPGVEGYPLLTIRQAYSTRLDTWVTTSGIIPGPDRESVDSSVLMAIANHETTFAGFRYGVNAILANHGNTMAGFKAAETLMEAADDMTADALGFAKGLDANLSKKPGEMN